MKRLLALIYRWVVYPVLLLAATNVILGMSPLERKLFLAAANFINPPQFTSLSTPGFTTYTIPSWAQTLDAWVFGAGGGGGSGGREPTGTIRTGGGGGAAATIGRANYPVSYFGGAGVTVPVAVGAGGLGGAQVTTNSTAGNPGLDGQMTGIGSFFLSEQPLPVTTNLEAILFANSQFVVVGASGVVLTSPSGLVSSWISRTSGTANQLNGIAYNGTSIYVAVGASGTIITSPDGVTWTTRTSNTAVQLNAVLWDGTVFVAVGNAGVIDTSPDGVTWTVNAFTSANNIVDIAYDGSSVHIAVDSQGKAISATTATGTWTVAQVTTATTYPFSAITYGDGQFVAVGFLSLYTSSNGGSTWSANTPFYGLNATPNGFRFSNGYFFDFASDDFYYSSDLAIWHHSMLGISPTVLGPQGIAFGAGAWVVAAGTGFIYYNNQGSLANFDAVFTPNGSPGGGGGTSNASGAAVLSGYGLVVVGAGSGSSSTASCAQGGNGVAGGGGCGGSVDASNTIRAPSPGGYGNLFLGHAIAGFPISATQAPENGVSTTGSQVNWGGSACGGGYYVPAGPGQAAGTTGSPSAGGCGGGASDNGNNSGAGSAGGNGEVRIWAHGSFLLKRDLAPSSNDNAPMYLAVVG